MLVDCSLSSTYLPETTLSAGLGPRGGKAHNRSRFYRQKVSVMHEDDMVISRSSKYTENRSVGLVCSDCWWDGGGGHR